MHNAGGETAVGISWSLYGVPMNGLKLGDYGKGSFMFSNEQVINDCSKTLRCMKL
jgi:hypothetical protein